MQMFVINNSMKELDNNNIILVFETLVLLVYFTEFSSIIT